MAISWPCVKQFLSLYYLLVAAITEVEIKGGHAYASSNYPAPWTADKAFILGHANSWHVAPHAYGLFPYLVWYEFPAGKTFIPARVSFRPRLDCCLNQGTGYLVTWSNICTLIAHR